MNNGSLEFLPIPYGGLEFGGGAGNWHHEMSPNFISLSRPNIIFFSPSLSVDLSHRPNDAMEKTSISLSFCRFLRSPWKMKSTRPKIPPPRMSLGKWSSQFEVLSMRISRFDDLLISKTFSVRRFSFAYLLSSKTFPTRSERTWEYFRTTSKTFSGPLTSRLTWRSCRFEPITIRTPISIGYS